MVAPFLTLYLAIGVGQVVAVDGVETAWLKAIPADADAAIRVRRLDLVRADLAKMSQAMSPTAADALKDAIDGHFAQIEAQTGKAGAENPVILVTRSSATGTQAVGMVIGTADPEAIKKVIADGREIKPGAKPGDPDFVATSDGTPMFLVKGAGFAGFSSDSTLAASLARPLDNLRWTETLVNSFTRGDIGILLNVPAIQKNHGQQIEQFKAQVIAGMDQAPNAGGGEGMKETIKGVVSSGFNALKVADLVAFYLDFEPYGLAIAGKATVLPGTAAAAKLEKATPVASSLMELLPGDATFFVDLAANPEMTGSLMKLGLSMGMGKTVAESDAMKKALALYQEAGIGEMATASFGTASTIGLYLANDPKKAVDASLAAMRAVGETKGDEAIYKSVTIKPEVQTFQGFSLREIEIVLDLEKIARLQPENPNAVESLRKMYGGDSVHSWVGTDGKRFLTASASSWEAAKAEIEPIVSGVGAIGKLPNYGTLREQLPLKTNFLMIGSAQGLVRQIARQMSAAIPGGADIKPGAMPAEIALFGAAVVASPGGYLFEFRLPSANGPVFEKGFVPVIQGLQGKVGM